MAVTNIAISRTKLFLSVIPEISDNDDNLTGQRARTGRRGWTTLFRYNPLSTSCRGTIDLATVTTTEGECQSRADLEMREGLEKGHA